MKLPEKFCFRVSTKPGFTHSAKVVQDTVKVKWARGWPEQLEGTLDWHEVDVSLVKYWVDNGGWIIVCDNNEQPKKEAPKEFSLPDVFEFVYVGSDTVYTAKLLPENCYRVSWDKHWVGSMTYPAHKIKERVAEGYWKILEKKQPAFPDVFHLAGKNGYKYTMTKSGDNWACRTYGAPLRSYEGGLYTAYQIQEGIDGGDWKLYTPTTLAAEQLRQKKDYEEQIAQLDNSIKIVEQTIEHNDLVIASYKERKEVLKGKITDIEEGK